MGPTGRCGFLVGSSLLTPPYTASTETQDGRSWDRGSACLTTIPVPSLTAPDSWGPQSPWEGPGAGNQERGTQASGFPGTERMGESQSLLWSSPQPRVGWQGCRQGSRPCWGSRKEGQRPRPSREPRDRGLGFSENRGLSSDPQVVVRVPSQHHGARATTSTHPCPPRMRPRSRCTSSTQPRPLRDRGATRN